MQTYHSVVSWSQEITSVSPVVIPDTLYRRCAVDRLQMDNGTFLILCTDASGKNASAGRILEITKGKDYGESQFPLYFSKKMFIILTFLNTGRSLLCISVNIPHYN